VRSFRRSTVFVAHGVDRFVRRYEVSIWNRVVISYSFRSGC
jgi:hypothetical protein